MVETIQAFLAALIPLAAFGVAALRMLQWRRDNREENRRLVERGVALLAAQTVSERAAGVAMLVDALKHDVSAPSASAALAALIHSEPEFVRSPGMAILYRELRSAGMLTHEDLSLIESRRDGDE